MLSTLTLVSLGLVATGGIEIVTVIDPATAPVAEIDAAVAEYANVPDLGGAKNVAPAVALAGDYRSDKPCPPVPPAEVVAPIREVAPTEVAVKETDLQKVIKLDELKPSTTFVVLRQEERPQWVEEAAQLKGDDVHFISVASDPWKTDIEAREALDKKLRAEVDKYIDDQIGRADAARRIHLPPDIIDSRLVSERYIEDLQFTDTAIGPMKQAHARLAFTPQFRAEIAERWKEHVVNARLLRTGLTAFSVLSLMVMAFGVLKRLGRR